MTKRKFLRQEGNRYKKLGMNWRRPKGLQSKLRRKVKGAGNTPNIGYRKPKKDRFLHPSGKREFLVSNLKELEGAPTDSAIRIGSTVGMKKRTEIEKEAKKRKIKILNPQVKK